MTYTYNIHDIVKIESDVMLLNSVFHRYFLSSDVSDPDLIIKIEKDIHVSKQGLSRQDLWFYGKEGEDFIYYEDKLFGMKDKVLVKNIKSKPTEIHATKSVLKINRRSRGSLFDLIEAIIDLKLLESGYLTIHAACLSKNNSAILLAAFPNIGKTLSTLYLLKSGFKYLYDDTGFIDYKGNAYSRPSTSGIHYADFLKFITHDDIGLWNYYISILKAISNKVAGKIFGPPTLDLLSIKGYESTKKSRVDIACCLEIGEKKIKQVKKEEFIRKILAINDYSRPRITQNPFMQVYAYFNNIDFAEINEMEKRILRGFLTHCKCFILSCNKRDWGEIIKEVYERNAKTE